MSAEETYRPFCQISDIGGGKTVMAFVEFDADEPPARIVMGGHTWVMEGE